MDFIFYYLLKDAKYLYLEGSYSAVVTEFAFIHLYLIKYVFYPSTFFNSQNILYSKMFKLAFLSRSLLQLHFWQFHFLIFKFLLSFED